MNFEQFRNYVWGMYGNNTISRGWELYKKSQHALWMARAMRACDRKRKLRIEIELVKINSENLKEKFYKWGWVECKCREKAEEYK